MMTLPLAEIITNQVQTICISIYLHMRNNLKVSIFHYDEDHFNNLKKITWPGRAGKLVRWILPCQCKLPLLFRCKLFTCLSSASFLSSSTTEKQPILAVAGLQHTKTLYYMDKCASKVSSEIKILLLINSISCIKQINCLLRGTTGRRWAPVPRPTGQRLHVHDARRAAAATYSWGPDSHKIRPLIRHPCSWP